MPSRFEPCGLGQLISFKYGAVPIVHQTGGLADTVINFEIGRADSSGFVFSKFHVENFMLAVRRAQEAFMDSVVWRDLVQTIMRLNFSWKESARKYVALYEEMVHG